MYLQITGWKSSDKTATSSNCIQGKDFIYRNGMKVFLFHLFMHMEIPPVITTDQGTAFNNHLSGSLIACLKIKHNLTTAYHPQISLYYFYMGSFPRKGT